MHGTFASVGPCDYYTKHIDAFADSCRSTAKCGYVNCDRECISKLIKNMYTVYLYRYNCKLVPWHVPLSCKNVSPVVAVQDNLLFFRFMYFICKRCTYCHWLAFVKYVFYIVYYTTLCFSFSCVYHCQKLCVFVSLLWSDVMYAIIISMNLIFVSSVYSGCSFLCECLISHYVSGVELDWHRKVQPLYLSSKTNIHLNSKLLTKCFSAQITEICEAHILATCCPTFLGEMWLKWGLVQISEITLNVICRELKRRSPNFTLVWHLVKMPLWCKIGWSLRLELPGSRSYSTRKTYFYTLIILQRWVICAPYCLLPYIIGSKIWLSCRINRSRITLMARCLKECSSCVTIRITWMQ